MNVVQSLQRFLNKYGFRCINEQKLEENSLHDDPGTLHLSLLSPPPPPPHHNTCIYSLSLFSLSPSPPSPPPSLSPPTPHHNTGFLVDMISGYVKTNSYSIANMEERETQIRCKAEETANNQLPSHKRVSSETLALCTWFTHIQNLRVTFFTYYIAWIVYSYICQRYFFCFDASLSDRFQTHIITQGLG